MLLLTHPAISMAQAADLMYFAMVRCVAAGVGLAEIESHLDRRSLKLQRRPGNDKKDRNDAAAKILQEAKEAKEKKKKQGGGGGGEGGGGGGGESGGGRGALLLPAAVLLIGLVAVVRSKS